MCSILQFSLRDLLDLDLDIDIRLQAGDCICDWIDLCDLGS